MMFFCPLCKRLYTDPGLVIVVTDERRKHRRGRIAWNRDGICPYCAKRKGNAK